MGKAIPVATDNNWEAEQDARSLIEAAEIRGDSKRLKKAKKQLDKQVKAARRAALENKVQDGMKKAFPKD